MRRDARWARIGYQVAPFACSLTTMQLALRLWSVSAEIKQVVFRSIMSPSLFGSRQGDRISEMEGEERDVVLRFPARG